MGLTGFFKRDRENDDRHVRKMRERFFLNRKPLEEPTFLGFKVMFDFIGAYYSPLLNISDESADKFKPVTGIGGAQGVNIPQINNDAAASSKLKDSAELFLRRNGYSDKANDLIDFISKLSSISQDSEWYFESIAGLESAFNFDFTSNKVRGGDGESLISITLPETLDMRITSMMSKYYNALYDVKNRRDLIPENLKYFSMTVYVADFRDFVAYDKTLFAGGNYASPTQAFERALGKQDIQTIDIPQMVLTFKNCYFDPFSFSNILAELNNSEPTQGAHTLDIRYNGDVEYSVFDLANNSVIDSKSDTSVINNEIKSAQDKLNGFAREAGIENPEEITNQLATVGSRLAGQGLGIINQNIERVRGELRDLALGNVYSGNLSTALQETLLNGAARSLVPGLSANPFNGE